MSRKPGINYWTRKGGGFFTTIAGRQEELALGPNDSKDNGPVYRAALHRYALLICQSEPAHLLTVRGAVAIYSAREWANEEGRHWKKHCTLLDGFVHVHGETRVGELLPKDVTAWLKGRTTWGPTTKQKAGRTLLAAFNYCVREGHLTANPLARRLTLPQPRSRGQESRMTPALMDLIESQARSDEVRLLLRVLRQTGARPVEILRATVERYDDGVITHPWNPPPGEYVWKSAVKTRRDRVIYLPADLAARVERMIGGRRTGPVFRTQTGRPWTYANLSKRWGWLLGRPAVAAHLLAQDVEREHLTPYAYRHTFISDWCDAGRSTLECARLCGTSVKMIESVYSHPDARRLRDHYLQFLAGR